MPNKTIVPTVSVIVPVYNAASFLKTCVDSVLSQSPDLELLLVDDGSTDQSLEMANLLAQKDPRVQVLQHSGGVNRGVSLTRSLGLSKARGDFVALLDADDQFAEGKLEKQIQLLSESPDSVLCHTGIEVMNDNPNNRDQIIEVYFNDFRKESGVYNYQDREAFLDANGICNSSVVVRRTALSKITYGHPQLFQVEDFVMWVLLSELGSFIFLREGLTGYRQHPGAYTASVNPLKTAYGKIEFLLCIVAFAQKPETIRRAEDLLSPALQKAASNYAQHHGITIDPKRLDKTTEDFAATFWKARAQHLESRINSLRNPMRFAKDSFKQISKRFAKVAKGSKEPKK